MPEKGIPSDIKDAMIAEAHRLGFADIGIARPERDWPAAGRLVQFLEQGYHGDMDWMARGEREHPLALWDEVQSVIMLTFNYGPYHDPMAILSERDRGAISVYAQGHDYHDIIKKKLKQLARWLIDRAGGDVKVFVDTAPIMEKPLAQEAGLGWQGKHTNLVARSHGSWTFLASIFSTLLLPADTPSSDHCGHCQACLDICPTKAFQAPYKLDARKCISYLTIEHKGTIAPQFRRAIGNRIYGCDDCLAVCPWNKFASAGSELKLQSRATLRAPELAELAALSEEAFRSLFTASPVKRIGHARFIRNVLIAIGNMGAQAQPRHCEVVEARLDDPSPLVRAMAVWALWEIAPDRAATLKSHALAEEVNADVIAEWQAYGQNKTT